MELVLIEFFKKLLLSKNNQITFSRVTKINELSGEVQADCSGIFNHFFQSRKPIFYNALVKLLSKTRLHACDYFNFFSDSKNRNDGCSWKLIKDVRSILPGDIFLWKKNNIPKHGDTGHMGIFLDRPKEKNERLFSALVADVSKLAHDEDDRNQGLGNGIMYFNVDENFELTGYIWSTQRKKNKRIEILCVRLNSN